MLSDETPSAPEGDAHFNPEAGFTEARVMLGCLTAMTCDAEELAYRQGVTRHWLKPFLAFLRPIEHFVRRLIFILAAKTAEHLPPPSAPAPKKKRVSPSRRALGPAIDGEDTSKWRVSFRMVERAHEAPRAKRVKRAPRWRHLVPSAPYAARLEALRRVLEDPNALIARLAKRLRAGAAIPIKLSPPKENPIPAKDPIGADWHNRACAGAKAAIAWRDTS
ncbi:MAG: hypothetical protein AB7J28_06205 [Hyphomonadaceae bacterium]